MPPDEYLKALDKALSDLEVRVQSRDLLNAEIAGLRETVRVLLSRVKLTPEKESKVAQLLAMVDYATPNLTDSIRGLLTRIHPESMTAVEVRNALEESQFNFDDFSNSLSACHSALKRMLTDKEVELGPDKNGKPAYRRILPTIAPLVGTSPFANIETFLRPYIESRDALTTLFPNPNPLTSFETLLGDTKKGKK